MLKLPKIKSKGRRTMKKVTLSAPWITFIREIELLFGKDDEVNVVVDSDELEVKLYVDNNRKAEALSRLLPVEKEFGNVKVKIAVIPSNKAEETPLAMIAQAFEGNPVFEGTTTVDTLMGSFGYAVFKKEVAQFYNDQLDDIHGNRSMLYQDIAKDVLGAKDGVFYCTSDI